jgi:hypothetical protein
MRARLAPVVATGTVRCARCDELIEPGSEWHLDHRDDGHGWLGPSHKTCNLRSGWESMVSVNGNGREFSVAPCRWSQRWFDDPPAGTIVFNRDGTIDVCQGNATWITLNQSELRERD